MEFEDQAYRDGLDALEFDEAAILRMTSRLLDAQDELATSGRAKPAHVRTSWRAMSLLKRAAVIAVALFALLIGGGTAYAAANGTDLSGLLASLQRWSSNYGGSSEGVPQTQGEAEKNDAVMAGGQSVSSGGVTMTFEGAYGGGTNFVAVFTMVKDDGTPFEQDIYQPEDSPRLTFDMEPDFFELAMTDENAPSMYFIGVNYTDDTLTQILVEIGVTSPKDWDGSTLSMDFSNLKAFNWVETGHSSPYFIGYNMLAEGEWEFDVTVDLSGSKVLEAGQATKYEGFDVTVTELSVSPLGVSISYMVNSTDLVDVPLRVVLADEMLVESSGQDGLCGGVDSDTGQLEVRKRLTFGELVDVDQIDAIEFGDLTIEVGPTA